MLGWVRERTGIQPVGAPAAASSADSAAAPPQQAPAAAAPELVHGDLTAIDRLPRRVPVPVLRPALALSAPTGVSLGEGDRVVVMLDEGGVGESLAKRLTKLGVDALTLPAGIATDELLARVEEWASTDEVHGVYWLAALDHEVLRRAERVWTSDCNDALERQTIQWGASMLIPYELMGAHIGRPGRTPPGGCTRSRSVR